ncbi:MAG: division/cell wall cluster transcriptional repressor MraZ [Methyloprofundus sp.]|nr:division/cell wall cluster transcriptional repressor MraZ [Methyloprofundus sp.]
MFRGVTAINLDAKGRFAIPTRYREELSECCDNQMVVTIAINEKGVGEPGCLWLYPLPAWEELEKSVSKLPTMNKMAGKLRRFLIGNATEAVMDKQGRLLLSDKLREFTGMNKKMVLVGLLNKFEIWDEAAWTAKEKAWMESDDTEGLEALDDISF